MEVGLVEFAVGLYFGLDIQHCLLPFRYGDISDFIVGRGCGGFGLWLWDCLSSVVYILKLVYWNVSAVIWIVAFPICPFIRLLLRFLGCGGMIVHLRPDNVSMGYFCGFFEFLSVPMSIEIFILPCGCGSRFVGIVSSRCLDL